MAKKSCPIEDAVKTRTNAGGLKETVKADKPVDEVISKLKSKGGNAALAEVPKAPREQMCTSAVPTDESGGKGKNIA